MNIKKVTAAIFTLIAVLVIIGAATIFFITSRDSITLTDISDFKENGFGVTNIVHHTESGDTIELSADYNVFKLGDGQDGLYRINVTLNQKDSKFYVLENLSAAVSFGNSDNIISSYCSGGSGVYSLSGTDYRNGKQVVCDFEGNYAYIDIIAQLSQTDSIPVNFTYDISGKGFNSLNGFSDQSCEMIIECDY